MNLKYWLIQIIDKIKLEELFRKKVTGILYLGKIYNENILAGTSGFLVNTVRF